MGANVFFKNPLNVNFLAVKRDTMDENTVIAKAINERTRRK